jgi:hypothetical protein
MSKQEEKTVSQDSSLAIVALVLGVVSLTGPGLIMGIPAIVIAIIALKKKLPGRGMSIAGLITGIVSTVLSLIFLVFMIFMMVWSINHPEEFEDYPRTPHTQRLQSL